MAEQNSQKFSAINPEWLARYGNRAVGGTTGGSLEVRRGASRPGGAPAAAPAIPPGSVGSTQEASVQRGQADQAEGTIADSKQVSEGDVRRSAAMILDDIGRRFVEKHNVKKDYVGAYRQLQTDLMDNMGKLCPYAITAKDLIATVMSISEALKGSESKSGKSPLEACMEFLTAPTQEIS